MCTALRDGWRECVVVAVCFRSFLTKRRRLRPSVMRLALSYDGELLRSALFVHLFLALFYSCRATAAFSVLSTHASFTALNDERTAADPRRVEEGRRPAACLLHFAFPRAGRPSTFIRGLTLRSSGRSAAPR